MERHGCVGEAMGWIPQHLTLWSAEEELVAAAPCYLKFNSYGEFVFDWSWASAFQRAGVPYYPKLVVASPYTPAGGRRILVAPGAMREPLAHALVKEALNHAERAGISSLHFLFAAPEETEWLESEGLMLRMGCQFHWQNAEYPSFDAMLGEFSAEKRKKVRRERRRVAEQGIQFRRLAGNEVSGEEWSFFHELYRSTFQRLGGWATLSLGFFQEIALSMGDQILVVLAYHGNRPVAAAFNLVGSRTLFGRHWGCSEHYHSLHFETCYYQGLDYCIERGLKGFEPGAQGEHKISRGFLPALTYSAHWVRHRGFRQAISDYLDLERSAILDYRTEMLSRSPFRAPAPP